MGNKICIHCNVELINNKNYSNLNDRCSTTRYINKNTYTLTLNSHEFEDIYKIKLKKCYSKVFK